MDGGCTVTITSVVLNAITHLSKAKKLNLKYKNLFLLTKNYKLLHVYSIYRHVYSIYMCQMYTVYNT